MNTGHHVPPTLPFIGTEENPAVLAGRWWRRYEELSDGTSGPARLRLFTQLLLLQEAHRRASLQDAPRGSALDAATAAWQDLAVTPDAALADTYQRVVEILAAEHQGALGDMFAGAGAPITDTDLLRAMIDDLGLLEDALGSKDGDNGGRLLNALLEYLTIRLHAPGRFYTPPLIIDAIVRTMQPRWDDVIADPACGSGGFLIAAQRYIEEQTPGATSALNGAVIESASSSSLASLALANWLLYSTDWSGDYFQVTSAESFDRLPTSVASLVLSNPPFGRPVPALESPVQSRPDFAVRTSSQALNHLQHIMAILAPGGRAAVVLPDNVLFETGAAEQLRRILLCDFEFHTLVRLPVGVFPEVPGLRANILFFDRPEKQVPTPSTDHLWIYDMRTVVRARRKGCPVNEADFANLIKAFCAADRVGRVETKDGQFRRFKYADLIDREGANLDLGRTAASAVASDSRSPQEIAHEIIGQLETALVALQAVARALPRDEVPALPPGERQLSAPGES